MAILEDVNILIKSQIENWQLAHDNYNGLKNIKTKLLKLSGGSSVKIQFNPERIRSSAAKVDKKSIEERPCFLCAQNRPAIQEGIKFEEFSILVNPFPIFPRHLTIVHDKHRNQEIKPFFESMLKLSKELSDIQLAIEGKKAKASWEEVPPAQMPLNRRIQHIIYGSWNSSEGPTKTMKQAYNILIEKLPPLLNKAENIDQRIETLRKQMDKIQAPWTPGRVPKFGK